MPLYSHGKPEGVFYSCWQPGSTASLRLSHLGTAILRAWVSQPL